MAVRFQGGRAVPANRNEVAFKQAGMLIKSNLEKMSRLAADAGAQVAIHDDLLAAGKLVDRALARGI